MIEPIIGFAVELFAQHHPRECSYYSGFYPSRAHFFASGPDPVKLMRVTLIDTATATENDYWAWWSSEDSKLKFIWASRVQVSMCFPYGPDAETDRGRIVRVSIEEVPDALPPQG